MSKLDVTCNCGLRDCGSIDRNPTELCYAGWLIQNSLCGAMMHDLIDAIDSGGTVELLCPIHSQFSRTSLLMLWRHTWDATQQLVDDPAHQWVPAKLIVDTAGPVEATTRLSGLELDAWLETGLYETIWADIIVCLRWVAAHPLWQAEP